MGTVILSFSCILFSAVLNTKTNTMNPMKCVLAMLGATAMSAPVPEAEAGWNAAATPALALGYAGLAAAPAATIAAAPAVGLGYAGYAAAPAAGVIAAAPAVAD